MATGGFSTKNASIAHYNSLYFEWGLLSFSCSWPANQLQSALSVSSRQAGRLSHGPRIPFSTLYFTLACILAVALIVFFSRSSGIGASCEPPAFQVVSIITTTGFSSDDFELMVIPPDKLIMVFLMFIGGCAGSTGGSNQNHSHYAWCSNTGSLRLKKLLHPNAFIPVRLGGRVVTGDVVTNTSPSLSSTSSFVIAGSVCNGAARALTPSPPLPASPPRWETSARFGHSGAEDNFAQVPQLANGCCHLLMLLGRLELYTGDRDLLQPDFWKKISVKKKARPRCAAGRTAGGSQAAS
jgi:trk system potassium uptake protein TrkH